MTALTLRGRWLQIQGLENARDLGGLRAGASTTRFGAVVRSEAPVRLGPQQCAELERYGLSVFLDLRSAQEAAARPSPFAGHPGYRHRPVLDGPALERAAGLDTSLDLLRFILSGQWRQLAGALQEVAAAGDRGVLLHCRAGKDRAGLMSALLLANADVDGADITADHAASRPPADPEVSDRFPATADSLRAALAEVGGAAYLGAIGLGTAEREALRVRLLSARSEDLRIA